MKKFLLSLITMLSVSIGTWADDSKISFGSNGSSIHYEITSNDWECWANVEIKSGDEAAFYSLWTSTESDASTFVTNFMTGAKSGRIQFGGQAATITMGSGSISMQGGAGGGDDNQSWKYNGNYSAPTTTITSSSSTELETWLNDATNGTKNQYLFNNMAPSQTTFSGENPVFTFGSSSSTVTLQTISGNLIGVLDLKGTDALSDWKVTTLGSGAFFSNLTYRININNEGTSYIYLGTNSATVHSNSNTDFASWLAGNSSLLSSVNAVTFDGEAKIETSTSDGTNNYIVINGNSATVTNNDNIASLLTWMNNTSRKYLSNVSTINFASETTYTIVTGTTVTFDTYGNATVAGDLTTFNNWKNGDNAKKLLSNKTILYNNVQLSDNDNCCYISLSADGTVATVHATTAGHFATMFNNANGYSTFPAGTTFKFDSSSNINIDDLKKLAGTETWQSNKYYVDLFDLIASDALCNNNTGVIGEAITWMRTNDRQFKGLILPKNHKLYGSGTTLIQGETPNTAGQVSTCSEFIAYYKTQEMKNSTPSDLENQLLVAHVYNASNDNTSAYNASFTKMKSLLDAHTEVGTNTDIYSISTNSVSKIDISALPSENTTRIEVINNEMVVAQPTGTKASMYAYTNIGGDFATAISATSLKDTPTDLMQINGPFSSADITSLNAFTNGPRVLDLKNVTSSITEEMLESIENNNIEYIILPSSMATKADVCNPSYSSKMTKLKAVIASSNTNLVAYVKQAGSLAEARYYATGGSKDANTGIYTPSIVGLTNVTLSGNLNAADLKANSSSRHVNSSGHWQSTGSDQLSIGLSGEQNTITSIDLRDANFPTYTDMNFSYAGLSILTDVKLPIASTMTKLPEDCLNNIQTLQQLCIPSNYTEIEKNALNLCGAKTIITDNDAHTLYIGKNGESFLTAEAAYASSNNTYTLSKNITSIKTGAFQTTSTTLTDIYALATSTPTCEKDAFTQGMYACWQGFTPDNELPYCREKYVNNGIFCTVLHYPAQGTMAAGDYDTMEKQYTDVTKIYTKLEQTGAKDANGRDIKWPTLAELNRVYAQAGQSKTWHDWATAYNAQQSVNSSESFSTDYTVDSSVSGGTTYTFTGYEGWHQFVLTMATSYQPTETEVENNKIVRRYVDAGYFTFCIPFDMTIDEVVELMGVPASDGTYDNYIGESNTAESSATMPEIYQLEGVTRTWGDAEKNEKNIVNLRLSENLYKSGTTYYLDFDHSKEGYEAISEEPATSGTGHENRCLVGGRPYVIKAYKRQGETIKSRNLGQYIMNKYGNKFAMSASCAKNGCYEQLGSGSLVTLQFAKPYEEHKVQAAKDGKSGSGWATYTDENNASKKYYYTMIGQFWTQPLPLYSIYMSGDNKWSRYTNSQKNYSWQAYKCVIMSTVDKVEDSGHNGGGFRMSSETEWTNYPAVESGTSDLLKSDFKLGFKDGRNDDDFSTNHTRYIFSFDDNIVEYDENGNEVSAIESLDGETIAPKNNDDRVFNMAGQYVGRTTDRLSKGMYIMNGKKIIVK